MAYHGIKGSRQFMGAAKVSIPSPSTIGVVGTADNADVDKFPLDTPVLVTSEEAASFLGADGTLPAALDAMYAQTKVSVVVVRVDHTLEPAATESAVIGDVINGKRTGIKALVDAKELGVTPRILCAPGFDHLDGVGAALASLGKKLYANVYLSGPNSTDFADVIDMREKYSSERVYISYPWVIDVNGNPQPPSGYVAGLRAEVDKLGDWVSISNKPLLGVIGTTRALDFGVADENDEVAVLNQNQISAIVQDDGYKLWGIESCASDAGMRDESFVRNADSIELTLQEVGKAYMAKNITGTTFYDNVITDTQRVIDRRRALGAVTGGKVWWEPSEQSPGEMRIKYEFSHARPLGVLEFAGFLSDKYNNF